jgi:hypothetical protein
MRNVGRPTVAGAAGGVDLGLRVYDQMGVLSCDNVFIL